jgi:hypothetical protein
MLGPLSEFFAGDHRRLDRLLARATTGPTVEAAAFAAFRGGLLRHIGMEEKVLLPAARQARGGEPLSLARRLRVEHGALALLLVPTPTPEVVVELLSILQPHNAQEEENGGLYDTCDALLASRADELLASLASFPVPPLNPHHDLPSAVRTAAEALRISAGGRPAPPK